MQFTQPPQLLKKIELCARLSISLRTLEYMVKEGKFPPPVRIGKYMYWSDKAVFAWQEKLFSKQENWSG
jgi:predicted DNA-binding transcriptional regulator AlpA